MDICPRASKKEKRQCLQEQLILVIDDSNFIQASMKNIFVPIGYKVLSASNGLEGVNLFRQYHPRVVFIDANMPVMDGFNTCHTIRNMHCGKNALLFMISTDSNEKAIEKAFEVGFDDYYEKPFKLDTVLTAKMKKFISKKNYQNDYENIKKQLNKTKILQNILLPRNISNPYVTVSHIYSPLEEVSGDMLDYWWDEENKKLYGYVLDAMGHGLSAAMQVSAIRMLFCQATSSGLKLDSAFSYINYEFYKSNTSQKPSNNRSISTLTTAILFSINIKDNTLEYVSAGISPFFITSKDGHMSSIDTKGYPLGYRAKTKYKIENILLRGIKEVIFCSDGFSELYYSQQEVLGKHDDSSAIIIKILGG